MGNQSQASRRRTFLRHASAVSGVVLFGSASQCIAGAPDGSPSEDGLYAAALGHIAEEVKLRGAIIETPVSLLQRHLLLGYARAIRLAAKLEQAGVWTVYHNAAGTRCARVIPTSLLA